MTVTFIEYGVRVGKDNFGTVVCPQCGNDASTKMVWTLGKWYCEHCDVGLIAPSHQSVLQKQLDQALEKARKEAVSEFQCPKCGHKE